MHAELGGEIDSKLGDSRSGGIAGVGISPVELPGTLHDQLGPGTERYIEAYQPVPQLLSAHPGGSSYDTDCLTVQVPGFEFRIVHSAHEFLTARFKGARILAHGP